MANLDRFSQKMFWEKEPELLGYCEWCGDPFYGDQFSADGFTFCSQECLNCYKEQFEEGDK